MTYTYTITDHRGAILKLEAFEDADGSVTITGEDRSLAGTYSASPNDVLSADPQMLPDTAQTLGGLESRLWLLPLLTLNTYDPLIG